MISDITKRAFFDELEKIANQVAGEKMDLPAMNMQGGSPPPVKPPKPPIAETLKTVVRKGGPILKNIEGVINAPQKPHKFIGTSYKRDFSGFKYS